MGFFAGIADKVRAFWQRDKESAANAFALSKASQTGPATGQDLFQAYGYDALSDHLRLESDLISRFIDYEEMDEFPEIASAMDIYADDASQPDVQRGRTIWATSADRQIEEMLSDDLLNRRLRMDEEIWEITRTVCKYGNDVEEVLVTGDGVVGLNFLPPPTVRRIEGPRGELYGFIQDHRGQFGYSPKEFQQVLSDRMSVIRGEKSALSSSWQVNAFEPWEVVHFRLRGKHRRSMYGYAVLEPARWVWKRLVLLEDAALIYRLQRAPERFAFYVDVGDLPPREALAYVHRVRQQHKKKKYFNPSTSKLDFKYEPLGSDEDFYVPVRKGVDGTRIEVLGAPSWQHMEDVEYFRDKLFAAIKVPKAYLAQDESMARAILSSEDVRFARTILRVQRELRNGMSKVCRIHLAALNIDPSKVEFDIRMSVPSAIFELAQLEVLNARADLAGRMGEFVSLNWILRHVFHLNEEEIGQIITEKELDAQRLARYQVYPDVMVKQLERGVAPSKLNPVSDQPLPPERSGESYESVGSKKYRFHKKLRPSVKNITERNFLVGDREGEKRASDKLEKLLRNDKRMEARLTEIGGFIREVASAKVHSSGISAG